VLYLAIQCKFDVKTNGKLTQNENDQKMSCSANEDIGQLIVNTGVTAKNKVWECRSHPTTPLY